MAAASRNAHLLHGWRMKQRFSADSSQTNSLAPGAWHSFCSEASEEEPDLDR